MPPLTMIHFAMMKPPFLGTRSTHASWQASPVKLPQPQSPLAMAEAKHGCTLWVEGGEE